MKPAKKTELYIKVFSLAVFAVLLIAASDDFYRFRVCFGAGKRIPPFTDADKAREYNEKCRRIDGNLREKAGIIGKNCVIGITHSVIF